jgi:predicted nucleic acid-binding protein
VIVADTNLIAYLLIEGGRTRIAEAVLAKDPRWATPVLWRSEFRNVLATYVRVAGMPLADALDRMASAESLLAGREHDVASDPVLRLAETSGCASYDCEFVQLALELGVVLVTSDRKLLDAFPEVAVTPEAFIG